MFSCSLYKCTGRDKIL